MSKYACWTVECIECREYRSRYCKYYHLIIDHKHILHSPPSRKSFSFIKSWAVYVLKQFLTSCNNQILVKTRKYNKLWLKYEKIWFLQHLFKHQLFLFISSPFPKHNYIQFYTITLLLLLSKSSRNSTSHFPLATVCYCKQENGHRLGNCASTFVSYERLTRQMFSWPQVSREWRERTNKHVAFSHESWQSLDVDIHTHMTRVSYCFSNR